MDFLLHTTKIKALTSRYDIDEPYPQNELYAFVTLLFYSPTIFMGATACGCPRRVHMLKANPQVGGIWMGPLGGTWVMRVELSVLIKEASESFLPLPPCEGVTRSLRPGGEPSLDHALILDCQPPKL